MGWAEAVFISTVVTAVMAAISVSVWQLSKWLRLRTEARAAIARDEVYRALAQRLADALEKTAEEQERIADEPADLRVRVGAIEKLLRKVE